MANTAPKASTGNYVCPSCKTAKFDTQRKLIEHALPCKRGELSNG